MNEALRVLNGEARWSIDVADALTWLRTLPDCCVNCCVTSPPYWGLRDYQIAGQYGLEKTLAEYMATMVGVFSEMRRVLRKDGVCFVNMGDSFTSGNRTQYDETARRRCDEPGKGRESHPSGGIQRKPVPVGLKAKDLIGQPWMLAFALRADGWYLRQDIIWHKPNPMPESITDRCTRAHEYVFMFSKSKRYHYDADAIRTPLIYADDKRAPNGAGQATTPEGRPASGTRYKMPDDWATHEGGHGSIHRNGREKGKKQDGHGRRHAGFNERYDEKEDRQRRGYEAKAASLLSDRGANARSVWTIATEGFPGAHFATFPTELARRCILAGCPGGGIVIEPFAGSGTTLAVAVDLGCRAIGCELNPDYAVMARNRISAVNPPLPFDRPARKSRVPA